MYPGLKIPANLNYNVTKCLQAAVDLHPSKGGLVKPGGALPYISGLNKDVRPDRIETSLQKNLNSDVNRIAIGKSDIWVHFRPSAIMHSITDRSYGVNIPVFSHNMLSRASTASVTCNPCKSIVFSSVNSFLQTKKTHQNGFLNESCKNKTKITTETKHNGSILSSTNQNSN